MRSCVPYVCVRGRCVCGSSLVFGARHRKYIPAPHTRASVKRRQRRPGGFDPKSPGFTTEAPGLATNAPVSAIEALGLATNAPGGIDRRRPMTVSSPAQRRNSETPRPPARRRVPRATFARPPPHRFRRHAAEAGAGHGHLHVQRVQCHEVAPTPGALVYWTVLGATTAVRIQIQKPIQNILVTQVNSCAHWSIRVVHLLGARWAVRENEVPCREGCFPVGRR